MHSLIERATWDDSDGSSHLASLNGTKTEMEAIFGTMTKIEMGIKAGDKTNTMLYEYQSEVKFKSDGLYFSVFTEMVPDTELDEQVHWKIDMHPDHFKGGLFTRIEALI